MHAERTEPKLELPRDLLSELQKRGTAPRTDMKVEGWKPSLVGRFLGLLGVRRAEEA
jgi:hypothetical protein